MATLLPYRFIVSDTAAADAATLAAAGINVRVFGPGRGVHPGALGAAHATPALSAAG